MFRSRRHALAAFGLLVSALLVPSAASAFEILGQVTVAPSETLEVALE